MSDCAAVEIRVLLPASQIPRSCTPRLYAPTSNSSHSFAFVHHVVKDHVIYIALHAIIDGLTGRTPQETTIAITSTISATSINHLTVPSYSLSTAPPGPAARAAS